MERIRNISIYWKRAVAFLLVLVLAVCSTTVLANKFTDPQTYSSTINSIDEKKVTVLGVSAAIAGSATLLAAVPDDATTPLAEEMMDLSSWLVLVVCVLVLEKSLLTVFGAVTCYVLIPISCLFVLIFIINKKQIFLSWAIKFAVLALAVLVIVPCAMELSDYIYEVNQVSIEQEVETIVESTNKESENKPEEDRPWYKKLWNNITEAVSKTTDKAVESGKQALNKFVDAVSVFIIAYCAIPVFVVFLLLWLFKLLFGLKINIDIDTLNPKRLIEKRKVQKDKSV